MSKTPDTKGFNQNLNLCIQLPADFLERLSLDCPESDVFLVLLNLFTLLSNREHPAELVDEFVLVESSLVALFQGDTVRLRTALEQALNAGWLLKYTGPSQTGNSYYLPSTPDGRALLDGLVNGQMAVNEQKVVSQLPVQERPNIYKLYEANIGPLTPMMAEMLKDDEQLYPYDWIVEAVGEAVQRNARNWKYVRAILKAWKEKGHGSKNEKDGTDLEKFRELYKEQKRKSGK
ncbi:MAG: DnaD domain protein [Anaerolineaceae bacterium]